MNDKLLPLDIGPLNPTGWGLVIGFVSFAIVYAVLAGRLLPRAAAIMAEREAKTQGVMDAADEVRTEAEEIRAQREAILAEARHFSMLDTHHRTTADAIASWLRTEVRG
ncbi:hypothetical protein [Streptomyces sp. NPDC058953]|uniref:hypothetical protein n=1 Tax=Streptomyces sp. NPDC058953 TaxID=3346676 RepID=UPI00367CACAB